MNIAGEGGVGEVGYMDLGQKRETGAVRNAFDNAKDQSLLSLSEQQKSRCGLL